MLIGCTHSHVHAHTTCLTHKPGPLPWVRTVVSTGGWGAVTPVSHWTPRRGGLCRRAWEAGVNEWRLDVPGWKQLFSGSRNLVSAGQHLPPHSGESTPPHPQPWEPGKGFENAPCWIITCFLYGLQPPAQEPLFGVCDPFYPLFLPLATGCSNSHAATQGLGGREGGGRQVWVPFPLAQVTLAVGAWPAEPLP